MMDKSLQDFLQEIVVTENVYMILILTLKDVLGKKNMAGITLPGGEVVTRGSP